MHKTAGRVVALFAASLIFVFSLRAQAGTTTLDLESANWSISARPNLAAKPPPKQVIQDFLTRLYPRWAGLYNPSEYDSFAFADLRQSGTLSLVAALAPGGPGGCGATIIADKEGQKFEWAWIQCMGSPIKIGGKTVVVSGKQISAYRGAASCPTEFPVIYGWNGSAYVDMSSQFPSYYRKKLDYLQPYLASYPGSPHYARGPLPCAAIIEAAAIDQYLGISPDGAIEDAAIRWSQSKNTADKEMAIDLLGSIGTQRARDYLTAMTSDSDPEVAKAAEGTLTTLNAGAHEDSLANVGHLKVDTGP